MCRANSSTSSFKKRVSCLVSREAYPVKRISYHASRIAFILLALEFGCGYKLGGGPKLVPGNVKSIAVPVFKNLTREPELGSALAEEMRSEILRRGIVALKPVDEAEAVLKGVAEEVYLDPLSISPQGFTSAYRVRLRASFKLTRHGEVLWRADHLERDEQIVVDNQILDNAVRREFALAKISRDFAKQVHTMMLEGF